MAFWQRSARLLTAVIGIACAIAVALALRTRPARESGPVVERSDPSAVVETAGGRTCRVNREKEEICVDYDRLLTYSNGSTRFRGVTVTTERAGGRRFVLKGDSAHVGEKESSVELEGHVQLNASDGLQLTTTHATYEERDGIVR